MHILLFKIRTNNRWKSNKKIMSTSPPVKEETKMLRNNGAKAAFPPAGPRGDQSCAAVRDDNLLAAKLCHVKCFSVACSLRLATRDVAFCLAWRKSKVMAAKSEAKQPDARSQFDLAAITLPKRSPWNARPSWAFNHCFNRQVTLYKWKMSSNVQPAVVYLELV